VQLSAEPLSVTVSPHLSTAAAVAADLILSVDYEALTAADPTLTAD
jgi:hypothetical protein